MGRNQGESLREKRETAIECLKGSRKCEELVQAYKEAA